MKPNTIKLRYVVLPIMFKAVAIAFIFFVISFFYQDHLSIAIGKSTFYHKYLSEIKWNDSIILFVAAMSIFLVSPFWLKKPIAFLEFKKSRQLNSVIYLSLPLFQGGLLLLAYSLATYASQKTYNLDSFNDWESNDKPIYFNIQHAEISGVRDMEIRYNYLSKNPKTYDVFCTVLLDRNNNLWLGISDHFFVNRGVDDPKAVIIEKIINANKKCDNTTIIKNASFKTSNFNLENNGFLAAAKRLNESRELNLENAQLLVHSKRSMEELRDLGFSFSFILVLLSILFLSYDTYNARINWNKYRETKHN
ncbi:hypothetical protein EXU30_08430 [Shewanella maritima]|uniref:Uncharacterized protein n=1 Tax=Shewanella maritima TaxID=2520507 RepID=A0A411PH56_9GAMM|nr:hypothetical protein [Shewanella maritima]QBF82712.1 hypothetical protein EXU30_08430 [Shewanella maritima]